VFALLDDDSYTWLSPYKWTLTSNTSGLKYARRHLSSPQTGIQEFVYLHNVIAGISEDYKMAFRDGNPLNMQRANMKMMNWRGEQVKWYGCNGRSDFNGVKWDAYYGLWKTEFKGMVVGYFVAEMSAAKAYNDKVAEVYGGNIDEINTIDVGLLNA